MDSVISFIQNIVDSCGVLIYGIVFAVAFFESFFIVGEFLPGAVFAFGSGYLASKRVLDIYILFAVGGVGAILADLVSFYLAFFFYESIKGKPFMIRYEGLFEKGYNFFKKWGGISVFVGRFIGALRPIVPFIAGVFRMDQRVFIFWATLSGILWSIVYFGAGYLFGSNLAAIKEFFYDFNLIGVVTIGFLVAAYFGIKRYFTVKKDAK